MTSKTNENHQRNLWPSPEAQRTENLQYIQTFPQQRPNVPIGFTQRKESLWSFANAEVDEL
jgi:hypothetical protein